MLIWGTTSRCEDLGVVADYCSRCARVRAHMVTQYFSVPHIYFIPLGRGNFMGTVRECFRCGTAYECEAGDYRSFVDEGAVRALGMRRLLEETNRRLLG